MNPRFKSRFRLSKPRRLKKDHKKGKLPDDQVSSCRITQEIDYNDTSNYDPLFLAVHNGELERIRSFLTQFSPRVIDVSGREIIHIAAARGHEQIICLLSQMGSEIIKGDRDGNTPLHLAVKENRTGAVNLLSSYITINLQNLKGATPLHIATQTNNFQLVELLLKRGAKVDLQDADGKTPLHIATGQISPNLKIVTILLIYRSPVHATCKKGFTPLHYVTTSGNANITELLMDYGALISIKNENKMDPLCLAIQENKTEMARYILGRKKIGEFSNLKNIGDMTPLHYAAQTGNEEIVKMLVTEGDAMMNASDEEMKTPLHFSAANGHLNVVNYLIESGALIGEESEGINTPLHLSAAAGHLEIVGALLNRGVKVDSLNHEMCTPLYLAVKGRHKEVVSLLVNKGARLDYRNDANPDMLPAFHTAAKNGDLEIINIFLKNGIEVNLGNDDDKTALHFASSHGHTKLVGTLLNAGADVNARSKSLQTPTFMQLIKEGHRLLDTF